LHWGAATALSLGALGAFWLPAWRGAQGFPAPLDDVLIHFDFARAAAEGHPFEWIAGQGYSSGETAPLYAAVLAVGHAVGFRDAWLGVWAAVVALACLVATMRGLRAATRGAPLWAELAGAALVVSAPLVAWSLASGMEVALFAAIAAWTFAATARACDAPATGRAAAQWRVGVLAALLVLTRPESVVVAGPVAVVVARHARGGSAVAALLRAAGPAAATTLAFAVANHVLSGDARAAGAQLKLLSSNPYLTDVERAREVVLNLVHFKWQVLDRGPAAWPRPWAFVGAVAVAGALARRSRWLALAALTSAAAWFVLVAFNGAARYQNFRYFAPALLLVFMAGAFGIGALARGGRLWRACAGAVALAACVFAAPRWPAQTEHFARAARNIREQQIEVGLRLARITPPAARVLVGDAGAIPYVSRRAAIDALGLGGFRGYPFAHAAPHGEAAIVELLEHLGPDERPTHLALYPNWFPGITGAFGVELDRVTITDNVICGGPTKGIYAADWSALGPARDLLGDDVDVIDVADVESERVHAYAVHGAPGFTVLAVHRLADGRRRFDGGRAVPAGARERFVVHPTGGARATGGVVRVRFEGADDARIDVALEGDPGAPAPCVRQEAPRDAWAVCEAVLRRPLRDGDAVTLSAAAGEHRTFHVWIATASPTAARP
jgi:hypothetical protein